MTDAVHPETEAEKPPSLLKRLTQMLRGDATAAAFRVSLEEVIEESDRETADLSAQERTLFANLLKVGERRLDDVMVPRADIVAVEESTPLVDLVALFREAQHSRLPVYRETLDTVTGMIHVKDVFAILAGAADRPASISTLIRQPRYVPEAMGVIELLAEMRATQTHLAIVVDEYSGTEGLVTIEDLVEEIVGDIEDEHDEVPTQLLVPLDDGAWDADARAELEDVAETVDPRLGETDEPIDTLGGLAASIADRIPQIGDMLEHDSGWTLEVTDGDHRRVTRLRLHPPATETVEE